MTFQRITTRVFLVGLLFLALFGVKAKATLAFDPLCGASLSANLTLTEDLDCRRHPGDVSNNAILTVLQNGITINGNGFEILMPDADVGVFIDGYSNVTVRNLKIRSFGRGIGILAESTTGLSLENIQVRDSSAGVLVNDASNLKLSGLNIQKSADIGLLLGEVSSFNPAPTGLNLQHNQVGLLLYNLPSNTVFNALSFPNADPFKGCEIGIHITGGNALSLMGTANTPLKISGARNAIRIDQNNTNQITLRDLDLSGDYALREAIDSQSAGLYTRSKHMVLANITANRRLYGVYADGVENMDIYNLQVEGATAAGLYLKNVEVSASKPLTLARLSLKDSLVGLKLEGFSADSPFVIGPYVAQMDHGVIESLAHSTTGIEVIASDLLSFEDLNLDNTNGIDANDPGNGDLFFQGLNLEGRYAGLGTGLSVGGRSATLSRLVVRYHEVGISLNALSNYLSIDDVSVYGATEVAMRLTQSWPDVFQNTRLEDSGTALHVLGVHGQKGVPYLLSGGNRLSTENSRIGIHIEMSSFISLEELDFGNPEIALWLEDTEGIDLLGLNVTGPSRGIGLKIERSLTPRVNSLTARNRDIGVELNAVSTFLGEGSNDIQNNRKGLYIHDLNQSHVRPELTGTINLGYNLTAIHLKNINTGSGSQTRFSFEDLSPLQDSFVFTNSLRGFLIEDTSYVRVMNLRLDTLNVGVDGSGNNNLQLQDLDVSGAGYAPHRDEWETYGIRLLNELSLSLTAITADRRWWGLSLQNVSSPSLSNIQANHCRYSGLEINGLSNSIMGSVQNLRLEDNGTALRLLSFKPNSTFNITGTQLTSVLGSDTGIYVSNSSKVAVNGATIQGFGSTREYGILAEYGNSDLSFGNLDLSGKGHGYGIRVYENSNVSNNISLSNIVANHREVGVFMRGLLNPSLDNITLKHSQKGLHLEQATLATFQGNLKQLTVEDNVLGIYLKNLSGPSSASPYVLQGYSGGQGAVASLLSNQVGIQLEAVRYFRFYDFLIANHNWDEALPLEPYRGSGFVANGSSYITIENVDIFATSHGIWAHAGNASFTLKNLVLTGKGIGQAIQFGEDKVGGWVAGGGNHTLENIDASWWERGLLALQTPTLRVNAPNEVGLRFSNMSESGVDLRATTPYTSTSQNPRIDHLDLTDTRIGLYLEGFGSPSASVLLSGNQTGSGIISIRAMTGVDEGIHLKNMTNVTIQNHHGAVGFSPALNARIYGIYAEDSNNITINNVKAEGQGRTDSNGIRLLRGSGYIVKSLNISRYYAGLYLGQVGGNVELSSSALTKNYRAIWVDRMPRFVRPNGNGALALDLRENYYGLYIQGSMPSPAPPQLVIGQNDFTNVNSTGFTRYWIYRPSNLASLIASTHPGLILSGSNYIYNGAYMYSSLCGTIVTTNLVISSDIDCRGYTGTTALTIGENNINFNMNGRKLLLGPSTYGILAENKSNVTITNGEIVGSYPGVGTGIEMSGGSCLKLDGVGVSYRGTGVSALNVVGCMVCNPPGGFCYNGVSTASIRMADLTIEGSSNRGLRLENVGTTAPVPLTIPVSPPIYKPPEFSNIVLKNNDTGFYLKDFAPVPPSDPYFYVNITQFSELEGNRIGVDLDGTIERLAFLYFMARSHEYGIRGHSSLIRNFGAGIAVLENPWAKSTALSFEGGRDLLFDSISLNYLSKGAHFRNIENLNLINLDFATTNESALHLENISGTLELANLSFTGSKIGLNLRQMNGFIFDDTGLSEFERNDRDIRLDGVTNLEFSSITAPGRLVGIDGSAASNSSVEFSNVNLSGTQHYGKGLHLKGENLVIGAQGGRLPVTANRRDTGLLLESTGLLSLNHIVANEALSVGLDIDSSGSSIAPVFDSRGVFELQDGDTSLQIREHSSNSIIDIQGSPLDTTGSLTGIRLHNVKAVRVLGLLLQNRDYGLRISEDSSNQSDFVSLYNTDLSGSRGVGTGLEGTGSIIALSGVTSNYRDTGVYLYDIKAPYILASPPGNLVGLEASYNADMGLGIDGSLHTATSAVLNNTFSFTLGDIKLDQNGMGLGITDYDGPPSGKLVLNTGAISSLIGNAQSIYLSNVHNLEFSRIPLIGTDMGLQAEESSHIKVSGNFGMAPQIGGIGIYMEGSDFELQSPQISRRDYGIALNISSGLSLSNVQSRQNAVGLLLGGGLGGATSSPLSIAGLQLTENALGLSFSYWQHPQTILGTDGINLQRSDTGIYVSGESKNLEFRDVPFLDNAIEGMRIDGDSSDISLVDSVIQGKGLGRGVTIGDSTAALGRPPMTDNMYAPYVGGGSSNITLDRVTANHREVGVFVDNSSVLSLTRSQLQNNTQGVMIQNIGSSQTVPYLEDVELPKNFQAMSLSSVKPSLSLGASQISVLAGSYHGIYRDGLNNGTLTLANLNFSELYGSILSSFRGDATFSGTPNLSGYGRGTAIHLENGHLNLVGAEISQRERGIYLKAASFSLDSPTISYTSGEALTLSHIEVDSSSVLELVDVRLHENLTDVKLDNFSGLGANSHWILGADEISGLGTGSWTAIELLNSLYVAIRDLALPSIARGIFVHGSMGRHSFSELDLSGSNWGRGLWVEGLLAGESLDMEKLYVGKRAYGFELQGAGTYTIDTSTIVGNYTGVSLAGSASLNVKNSDICANGTGLYTTQASIARNNYWRDSSGPSGTGLSGTGDRVEGSGTPSLTPFATSGQTAPNEYCGADPTADAGISQLVCEGDLVTLDGSGSTTPMGTLTYQWSQSSGTSVTLSSTSAQKPTFTAPTPSPIPETLGFSLFVSNGSGGDTDSTTVTVRKLNQAPIASAISPIYVNEGGFVYLDATGSTDPNQSSNTLGYLWTQPVGQNVQLDSSTSSTPSFVAPLLGALPEQCTKPYQFTVTVSDQVQADHCGQALSDYQNVTVYVESVVDTDGDGLRDCEDACPLDPNKTAPGHCGCGISDSYYDPISDSCDLCPDDPNKTEPGLCGCGVADTDSDQDGTPDCLDLCPNDPSKTSPGYCGCGVADIDSDGDGLPDCVDQCLDDDNESYCEEAPFYIAVKTGSGPGQIRCHVDTQLVEILCDEVNGELVVYPVPEVMLCQ